MKIVFRVDSGFHMGIGHVMRSLTLANELIKNGHEIIFITKNHLGFSRDQIMAKYELHILEGGVDRPLTPLAKANYIEWLGEEWQMDLIKTNSLLGKIGNVDLVVIDHYSLDEHYERGVACSRVMVIDDLMNRMHFCDLLLDQNITAVYEVYKKLCLKENTQLLMGPEFALLRPEFEEKHNSVNLGNELRSIKKILVFFGASDVNGDCLKMAKSIPDFLSSYEFTFILNEQHADFNELKNILSKYSNIRLLSFVDNLADLMVDHDLFIGAGGTTSWERACLGMATALFSVADNQTPICEELGRRKISYYVGHSQLMTKAKWTAFFKQIVPDHSLWYDYRKEAFQLVDGKGVRKVVAAIEHINVKN